MNLKDERTDYYIRDKVAKHGKMHKRNKRKMFRYKDDYHYRCLNKSKFCDEILKTTNKSFVIFRS